MKEDGVWRTIGGRKVFIKNGQDLETAMKESGKFRNLKSKFKYGYYTTDISEIHEFDSLYSFIDENGNLKEEREKLHKQIIDECFKGKIPVSDNEKTFYMTGGGSGSGKSNFLKNADKFMGQSDNTVILDCDSIKGKFPEFDITNIDSARFLHEESSALTKRILKIGIDNNYNMLLDGTGDGGENSILKKITSAKEKGYKVIASYATIDEAKAQANNITRFNNALKEGKQARLVPVSMVRKTHRDVSNVLPKVADKFDRVDLYDMNDYNNIKHIAVGGNGKKLTVIKGYEKEYESFLKKKDLEDIGG